MIAKGDVSLVPRLEAIAMRVTVETAPTSKIKCVYVHTIYVMLCGTPGSSLVS